MRVLAAIIVCAALAVPAAAQSKPKAGAEDAGWGLAAGPLAPVGGIADAYSFGLYATLRGYYFPSGSPHGVRAGLWLAGIDDVWVGHHNLDQALRGAPAEVPHLLLCHEPDYATEAVKEGVSFQLSGHTHGGQIRLAGRPLMRYVL